MARVQFSDRSRHSIVEHLFHLLIDPLDTAGARDCAERRSKPTHPRVQIGAFSRGGSGSFYDCLAKLIANRLRHFGHARPHPFAHSLLGPRDSVKFIGQLAKASLKKRGVHVSHSKSPGL